MKIDEILKTLISFQTTTENISELSNMLHWVKEDVKDLPVFITDKEFESHPSLLITTQETNTPLLWLYCHIDVVPAKEEAFQASIEDNKLYGRGALDMKFALASYLGIFHEIGEKLPEYDIGIMLVSDEETGGFYGAGKLREEGYLSKAIVIPDGGDDLHLETKAKGIWHLSFQARGESAHGSRPWEGENAIDHLINLLQDLQSKCSSLTKNKDEKWCTTMNIGKVTGGTATNQVPAEARACVDIRYTSPHEKQMLIDTLDALKIKYPRITHHTLAEGNCLETNLEGEYVKKWASLTEAHTGEKMKSMVSHGASDARFFADVMPTIVTRPTGGGFHGENEWIDLGSLETFHQILQDFVVQKGRSGIE